MAPPAPTPRTVTATRYVTPLREGGSLPAVVEADDLGLYVLKFRGAGQGVKALVAELIAGELARAAGLAVPEIVLVELDPVLGRAEPDSEIRALLKASAGLNLGLDYLPGSVTYDAAADPPPPADLASAIVCFDAYVTNVDRTARNPNLLWWHEALWLIDHGAALYFHHAGGDWRAQSRTRFPQVRDHVLLRWASVLAGAQEALRARLTREVLAAAVAAVPDAWLQEAGGDGVSPASQRAAYLGWLEERLDGLAGALEEAERARALLL